MALTPPSTEFSIGTSEAATSPSRTACRARPTVAYGIGSTTPGRLSSAWWAKVPTGPKKPYGVGAGSSGIGPGYRAPPEPFAFRQTAPMLEEFIAGLPKAELHVHQVGSASTRIVAQLAERHPGTVPSDPEELAQFFVFDDFPHFIRNYLAVVQLIKTAEDVRLLTYEVAADMATQNIRYAELTVTPYISISDSSRPRPSWKRSRTRGSGRSGTTGWSCSGSSTSRPTSDSRRPSSPPRWPWTTTSPGWSASGSAGRSGASRGRCSAASSTARGRPGCTA